MQVASNIERGTACDEAVLSLAETIMATMGQMTPDLLATSAEAHLQA